MKNLTLVFKLMMMAIVITGVTACSKNEKKGASLRDRRTQQVGPNGQPVNVPGGPRTNFNNSVCPSCGYIYNTTQNGLMDFLLLSNPSDLGVVSPTKGANTGVFFRGEVKQVGNNEFSGKIQIVVWDQYADTQYPYIADMVLQSASTNLSSYATLTFKDSAGTVTLDGSFQNGYYTGTVTYINGNGSQRSLGNFETGDCNFITAGCN